MVLIVFYICYLPFSTQDPIASNVFYNSEKTFNRKAYDIATTVSRFLLFSNSCLNPVIYSRIHLKIFNFFKILIEICKDKCLCKTELNCCKKQCSSSREGTQNENQYPLENIFVHGRTETEEVNLEWDTLLSKRVKPEESHAIFCQSIDFFSEVELKISLHRILAWSPQKN